MFSKPFTTPSEQGTFVQSSPYLRRRTSLSQPTNERFCTGASRLKSRGTPSGTSGRLLCRPIFTASRPFQVTGIDLAGPVYVKGKHPLRKWLMWRCSSSQECVPFTWKIVVTCPRISCSWPSRDPFTARIKGSKHLLLGTDLELTARIERGEHLLFATNVVDIHSPNRKEESFTARNEGTWHSLPEF